MLAQDNDLAKVSAVVRPPAVVTSISELYQRFQLYQDRLPGLPARTPGLGLWYSWYPGLIPPSDGKFMDIT